MVWFILPLIIQKCFSDKLFKLNQGQVLWRWDTLFYNFKENCVDLYWIAQLAA